ncbi:MAG: anthranilate phosphoribosyltransferase [Acidimicrobiales bacterium]|nr:anthranilate phosphoribosyltransferase [Acidimicrobiales bacterium]
MADQGFAEHGGWPVILGSLMEGGTLTREQARVTMAEILDGAASPAQISAFIVALRMKGETVEELVGMVEAMLDASERVSIDVSGPVVDVVGTGGDRAHTINVSTISALVVAGAGGKVCKHGNRAASSACGAADLLEALGVAIELGPAGVARCVEEAGMGFCFAPRYHPAMRHAGPSRRDLGIPTAFNILGPLSNPARVRRYLIGVADLRMAERMAGVLQANGAVRALIVHGGDGLDELTTTGPSTVVELHDGRVTTWEVDPESLGLPRADREDLVGGDAHVNADLARRVLAGEHGPHRDIITLNAGAALLAAGFADDLPGGMEAARAALDGGAAVAALARLVEVSQASAHPPGRAG